MIKTVWTSWRTFRRGGWRTAVAPRGEGKERAGGGPAAKRLQPLELVQLIASGKASVFIMFLRLMDTFVIVRQRMGGEVKR
jgi:hypothetical protein